MDRTGLLAILVMVFTLTAGVGPALGLSPAVAAATGAVVFIALGVDQFLFQGRLVDLAVGLVQERQPGWRERVARHEAGHLLVALRTGIGVEGYILGSWEAFRRGVPGGGGVVLALPPERMTLDQIEAYCATYLAGGIAEELTYGKALGGGDDRQKLALLLGGAARIGNIAPTTLRNRAGRRAVAILKTEAELHSHLSEKLLTGQALEVCLQLVEQGKTG